MWPNPKPFYGIAVLFLFVPFVCYDNKNIS